MRPAEKSTAKTTFIYFAILVALIFNLLAGPIPLKHPPLHLKHVVCKEKGLFYSYKNCIPNCNLNLMLFIKLLAEFNSCSMQQQNRKKILCGISLHSAYFSQIN